MASDDSQPWRLAHQNPDGDDDLVAIYIAEFRDRQQHDHLARIAERKLMRAEQRRLAKGLTADPVDYPWLKPDWVEPKVRPFKG